MKKEWGEAIMKHAMKQSTLLSILNFVTIGLAIIMGIFFVLVMFFNNQVIQKTQVQIQLNHYAQQFIDASENLTESVRGYAATGDKKYYDAYNTEVNVDQNRENSIMLMEEIGITDTEMALIDQMAALSDQLVPLEQDAMKQVQMNQSAKAIQYVYGTEYSNTLTQIHELQSDFLNELETRTQNEINQADRSAIALQIISIIFAICVIISQVFSILITKRRIIQPIHLLKEEMIELSKGNLDAESKLVPDTSELGMLISAMHTTKHALRSYISDIRQKLNGMAQGNMNQTVELDYVGDFAEIKHSLEEILLALNHTLHNIDQSAERVNENAVQVADGAQALAQGSTEQASSVQELAATISDVSQQINQTAVNVDEAMQEINRSSQDVMLCNQKMSEMTEAMNEIRTASQQIANIIKAIEDIAFQTNILALNAAVEAARAGAAGKGFAVVADEVSNLASKSAEASKQTAQLIDNATTAVDKGVVIATETAEALLGVVHSIQKSDGLMSKIYDDTRAQTDAVSQIDIGVGQISTVVQTNSATVEQSAAASAEMGQQANLLKSLVNQFQLSQNLQNLFGDMVCIKKYLNLALHNLHKIIQHKIQNLFCSILSHSLLMNLMDMMQNIKKYPFV